MRAGLVIRIRVTAASRGATVVPIPTGRGLALLADVADRECRDGFSQPVIGRKHPVVAMPVLPRRRDEIGEPVEELNRRVINVCNPTMLFVHGTLLVTNEERFARVLQLVKNRTLTASLAECTIVPTKSSKRQAAIAGIVHHLTSEWAPAIP